MRLVYSEHFDVYQHLAAEAYFLHEYDGDVLMIWRSHDAVVCGKHQNACGEANYKFCQQNNIRIARRLSGGGTVFHDLGNINFTFVKRLTEGMERAVDYKRYLEPVRTVLRSIGVETTYSQRDDLLLNHIKISGNAQHIYQKGMKGLHHGTLLYDANLISLGEAIHSGGVYEGKSVPSNRSSVTNIREWHDLGTTESFIKQLLVGFESLYGVCFGALNAEEQRKCASISQEKFSQESWILGYSPRYTHKRVLNWSEGSFQMEMRVHQDAIEHIQIVDAAGALYQEAACSALVGKPLRLTELQAVFEGVATEELLELF
jgi:lipoate-protein ligase A